RTRDRPRDIPRYTPRDTPRYTPRDIPRYTPRRDPPRGPPPRYTTITPPPPRYAPRFPSRLNLRSFPSKKKKKFKQPTEYKPTVYSISRGFKATKSAIKKKTKGKRLTKSGLGLRPTQKGY
ncbi:hypothetical protein CMI37_25170, partial [Candidatus Pacearchaeota archaeon]|nr:hypothetical protein [Candidatus Pacearchaeota archaeon]